MEKREDRAAGIIPVHKQAGGELLFCIVHEADGHWGFPKGHREEGESDEQAARRELQEETGIESVDLISDVQFRESYPFVREEGKIEKTVTYFLGLVSSMKSATNDAFKAEIPEYRWLSCEEAKKTLTYPEARKVLDEVWEYLKSRH